MHHIAIGQYKVRAIANEMACLSEWVPGPGLVETKPDTQDTANRPRSKRPRLLYLGLQDFHSGCFAFEGNGLPKYLEKAVAQLRGGGVTGRWATSL
jgi:hypothetical protein